MNHVFIYALPTSQSKDARMMEISAVRVPGFGPYNRKLIQETFMGHVERDYDRNPKALLSQLYKSIITPEPYVLISYNNEVTKALLRIENEKAGLEDCFQGRAWIDVNALAWPMLVSGQVTGRNLEKLSSHFGVTIGKHSDSADVVTALLQIYGFMMRRYKTALHGESVIREAGGETLSQLRNIIGF